MKVEKKVQDMDGNARVVTVTYTHPDTIDKTDVDRILSISVDLAFNGSNKVISYAGHSFNILGNTELSNIQFLASDVNQDSIINIQDIILVVNMILNN